MIHVIATVDLAPRTREKFQFEFRKLNPDVRAQAGGVTGGFQAAGPAVRRVVGDAFATGLHAGYLLGGVALLSCTVLAVTLLGAFRRQPTGPPTEPEAAMASSRQPS